MKKLLSFAFGAAMIFGLHSQDLKAQVYADYDLELRTNVPFEALVENTEGVTVKNSGDFWVMPTKIQNNDDGYVEVSLPFTFTFNGVDYTKVYVSVNGFMTFNTPPNVAADQPQALFTIENSYADNIIAPYWGDHYYRTTADNEANPGANQYVPSKVLVKSTADQLVVEWRDLNVFVENEAVTSSIATFQAILYKSTDANSNQGAIEFAYSVNGKKVGQQTSDNRVFTTGASIGLKGESGIIHHDADFINALLWNSDKEIQISNKATSEQWQPTGGSDIRFHFEPNIRYAVGTRWGDGDADMSRVAGGKHFNYQDVQNRYVTVSDAREIINSIATKMPLDSIKGRAAFHGDVNHNGRFIYTADGEKYDIYWRSAEFNDDLPLNLIGSAKQLMFQVTEYDAAMILHYLAARLPYLPWTLDTIPMYGKVVDAPATAVVMGTPEALSNGTYTMPVYVNGLINGALASKFDFNGIVEDVVAADEELSVQFEGGRVVVAGSSKFNSGEAICYVNFRSNEPTVKVSDITFNDVKSEDVTFDLAGVEDENVNEMLSNYPNPFSTSTAINVNVENNGFYTLSVYDVQGNLVKNVISGNLNAGMNNFVWDGTDAAGNKVQSGMYIYRLVGNNVCISNTMQIVK